MAEAGLSVHQTFEPFNEHMVLITTLTHESGEYIPSKFPLNLNWESLTKGNKLQNIGSTLSYIRRYSLQAILNLATDDDDDAVSNTYVAPKPQPKTEPEQNKYDKEAEETLLNWVEQAKLEIAEIAFPGRLMAWKKDNNNMLGRLQKAHPDKFAEVGAAYKTAEENLKGK